MNLGNQQLSSLRLLFFLFFLILVAPPLVAPCFQKKKMKNLEIWCYFVLIGVPICDLLVLFGVKVAWKARTGRWPLKSYEKLLTKEPTVQTILNKVSLWFLLKSCDVSYHNIHLLCPEKVFKSVSRWIKTNMLLLSDRFSIDFHCVFAFFSSFFFFFSAVRRMLHPSDATIIKKKEKEQPYSSTETWKS